MATENSGPHLPSSWPEPPRRDASPAWSDSAAEVPTSWPSAPAADVPTAWPEASRPGHPEPSWPEPPRKDPSWPEPPGAVRPGAGRQAPTGAPQGASWPEPPRQEPGRPDPGVPTAWPESASSPNVRSPWPDNASSPDVRNPWPDNASSPDVRAAWPENASSPDVRAAWQDAPPPPQSAAGPAGWPEVSSKGNPPPSGPPLGQPADPVPAWAQPPAPAAGAWSNLSSPAPWPPADRAAPAPPAEPGAERTAVYNNAGPPAPAPHPADERTVTYNQHTQNLLNERAVPSSPMDTAQPHTDTPQGVPPTTPPGPPGPPGPPPGDDHPGRPGSNLSRDPSDPQNRFVTAGQISGSRTPPPERQQELWNTVFGDDYQSMGDQDALDDEEQGKPIWIYALGGSVAVALVAALLWAFLWGPLAGEEPSSSSAALAAEQSAAAKPKPSATKSSTTIGPLPRYTGKASPVIGRVPDAGAGISVPRLGGTWQLDQRATVKGTYGFDTRQYVQVAPEKYATVMSGPLAPRLSSYYEPDNLEPVIKQVVLSARRTFFPDGNKVRKIAQQPIKVGDQTGRLIAYELTADTEKATIATMAINTGGQVPAIVYISIPSESKQLLPDIRTVMNQIRLTGQS
ncbi:hypothetical protein [Nonomuraea gerenzanensis]|uniref:hypothetical protein n=1 Tax=Nonomuraea gerenzanensis TaxID=93944 RepID=UPI001CD9E2AB|nr:hypothetical protein [Nonomuraea gerenzanensis]UBU11018.1 hypothetical protein LCN96_42910 [Nonomuraea gerenzanensis]